MGLARDREAIFLERKIMIRDAILQLLKEEQGTYVSGERMSEVCEVTRTAIWKHIQALRMRGYEIESSTKKGYRLIRTPDLLHPQEIDCRFLRFGKKYYYMERVDSTNIKAKELAAKGEREGTIVVAEEQTAGRGRLDRGWYSPLGKGIWMSLILRPPYLPMEAPKTTLMVAVALVKTLRELGVSGAKIKWPNDILVGGRKVAGILTEMQSTMDHIEYLVIGIGLNTSLEEEDFPQALRQIATSMVMEGICLPRYLILEKLLHALEAQYESVVTQGFRKTLEEWRSLNNILGQEVQVHASDGLYTGFAEDIDDEGHLIVGLMDGSKRRVVAGDVSVRTRMQLEQKKPQETEV